jgi:hypothetical protein
MRLVFISLVIVWSFFTQGIDLLVQAQEINPCKIGGTAETRKGTITQVEAHEKPRESGLVSASVKSGQDKFEATVLVAAKADVRVGDKVECICRDGKPVCKKGSAD